MTIVGSYNIHKAVGTDLRRDPSRVVQVIAEMGADIVGLQVDRRFWRPGGRRMDPMPWPQRKRG